MTGERRESLWRRETEGEDDDDDEEEEEEEEDIPSLALSLSLSLFLLVFCLVRVAGGREPESGVATACVVTSLN